jgi:hypothetical protein
MTNTTQLDVRTRTLHLVDIENLIGDPCADGATAAQVLDDYLVAARWSDHDLVVIAANPGLTGRIAWQIEFEHRILTATGPDGADLMLLAQAAPEFVARRAGRLVIGSGDHIFIERALRVRDLGVGVVVVARADHVSRGWFAHGFPVVALGTEHDSLALVA